MKQSHFWLMALLSVLTLVTTSTLAIADDNSAHYSGSVELGATGTETKDNPARVNEYATYHDDDGYSFSPSLNLEYENKGFRLDTEMNYRGDDDQKVNLDVDFSRIFRLEVNYLSFNHWLDHDNLNHMGATMKGDVNGGQPTVSSDKTLAAVAAAGGGSSIGGVMPDYDPALAYAQEVGNDYIITRREWKSEAALTLPALSNVTFHAGFRVETRDGLKQAIGLSKCDGCHVSATGKEIDERTEDISLGATGKFGPVTIDYEMLLREFDEKGSTPVRFYDAATTGDAGNQLLYGGDDLEFNRTPDSEKISHALKARGDFANDTKVSLAYTRSKVESDKSDVENPAYVLLKDDTLESEYESFGGKVSTRLGNWRLAARASRYEISTDGNEIYFPERDTGSTYDDNGYLPFDVTEEWETAEDRTVTELGLDAVYRLARATTLSLGYAYENVDREEEELGETTTNTFKIALKSRLNNQLSGRISYQYQDIDDPFHGEDITGIAQGLGDDPLYPGLAWLTTADFLSMDNNSASKVWYWNSVYPNRTLDATQQPDQVHEAKLSTTWAPTANMAATLFARVRMEENDDVHYEQKTYVPGLSVYYAPNGKLNLTMAYTFNKQETENQMCVGWYHG